MLKKSLIGIVIIAVLTVLVTIGIQKYFQSTTKYEYAQLPEDDIPELYEKVTYTIPTIDQDGDPNSQTFTIDNEEVSSNVVKLAVRNDKVKSHEFIDKEEVPRHVKEQWPQKSF